MDAASPSKVWIEEASFTFSDATALDHVTVPELHRLRTLRPQLAGYDYLIKHGNTIFFKLYTFATGREH